jgi:hypothetical protein
MARERQIATTHLHHAAFTCMVDKQRQKPETGPRRIKLTARLTLPAYDAIAEIQRRYRRKTGRALPLWKVLDAAILAYAQKLGSKVGE